MITLRFQMIEASNKKVTLTEIARQAGVSSATVSRAINPRTARLVKPKTLEKIRKIQDKLDYRHNILARNMRKQKTETITLATALDTFNSPHHSDFAAFNSRSTMFLFRDILDEALRWGYDVKIMPILNTENFNLAIDRIGFPYSDGVICIGLHQLEEFHAVLKQRGIPEVIISNHIINLPDAAVVSENCDAAYAEAVDYVMKRNCRKIAFATLAPFKENEKYLVLNNRFQAWRNILLNKGIYDEKLIIAFEDELDLRSWLTKHHRNLPFDALFCSGDSIAARFVREAKLLGIDIPRDLKVIGHGANPVFLERDGLASIGGTRHNLACEAVRRLIGIIEETAPFTGMQVIQEKFIKGETCP